MTNIPKKIHYVWIGNAAKPNLVNLCLLSWKDKLTDYEIVEWNENNFPFEAEFKNCRFLKECYDRKLWAFVSDYMRVYVLFHFGGVYLDTDMYMVKGLLPLLEDQSFVGFESDQKVAVGIAGSAAGEKLWEQVLSFYNNEIWSTKLCTIPDILTTILLKDYGLTQNGKEQILNDAIHVYPREYFYPYYYTEEFTLQCITPDTYGIHWWSASWKSRKTRLFLRTKHLHGLRKWLKSAEIMLKN